MNDLLSLEGAQEDGQATAASSTSVAGKVAAGKLSGEAARHRAHRATLMGASVKPQQADMQVLIAQVAYHPQSQVCMSCHGAE